MSNISKTVDYAFGAHKKSNKCYQNFIPFFTNLFNPENHLFEEKRVASRSIFGSIAKKTSRFAHKHGRKAKDKIKKGVHKAGHIVHIGAHLISKYGGPAAKKAIKAALHAPELYGKINKAFGGKLDIMLIMGCSTAGTAIGGAVGFEFFGIGELVGGPLGGSAGGTLGKMAVAILHKLDGHVTQK